jgi:hypothetical protein
MGILVDLFVHPRIANDHTEAHPFALTHIAKSHPAGSIIFPLFSSSLRGLPFFSPYGGGTWTDNGTEIMCPLLAGIALT